MPICTVTHPAAVMNSHTTHFFWRASSEYMIVCLKSAQPWRRPPNQRMAAT